MWGLNSRITREYPWGFIIEGILCAWNDKENSFAWLELKTKGFHCPLVFLYIYIFLHAFRSHEFFLFILLYLLFKNKMIFCSFLKNNYVKNFLLLKTTF
jgi:hypothetical protein